MSTAEPESERSVAVNDSILDAELRSIYDDVNAEVARAGPVCELSGRCCRFQEYGHTLFVSTAEFSYLVRHAPPPVRPVDSGETCPWQDAAGRCQARDARPLGCRVYFCDPAYQETAPVLSEQFIARLKRYAERHDLEWNYAPLHQHLHAEAYSPGR
jgi:hypothetical protein